MKISSAVVQLAQTLLSTTQNAINMLLPGKREIKCKPKNFNWGDFCCLSQPTTRNCYRQSLDRGQEVTYPKATKQEDKAKYVFLIFLLLTVTI